MKWKSLWIILRILSSLFFKITPIIVISYTAYLHIHDHILYYIFIFTYSRDMYLRREMKQILMDLNFDLFYTDGVNSWSGMYTFLFISKIHPNTEIRDRNLSPSKVVKFLYVGNVHVSDIIQILCVSNITLPITYLHIHMLCLKYYICTQNFFVTILFF